MKPKPVEANATEQAAARQESSAFSLDKEVNVCRTRQRHQLVSASGRAQQPL
jgi:hypothetical protein